jgi:hypothetical protein
MSGENVEVFRRSLEAFNRAFAEGANDYYEYLDEEVECVRKWMDDLRQDWEMYEVTWEEVDEAHARCLASGANVHFPPEEDRDEPGYYAFFAFDPDGIRVEVFCWPR